MTLLIFPPVSPFWDALIAQFIREVKPSSRSNWKHADATDSRGALAPKPEVLFLSRDDSEWGEVLVALGGADQDLVSAVVSSLRNGSRQSNPKIGFAAQNWSVLRSVNGKGGDGGSG